MGQLFLNGEEIHAKACGLAGEKKEIVVRSTSLLQQ